MIVLPFRDPIIEVKIALDKIGSRNGKTKGSFLIRYFLCKIAAQGGSAREKKKLAGLLVKGGDGVYSGKIRLWHI